MPTVSTGNSAHARTYTHIYTHIQADMQTQSAVRQSINTQIKADDNSHFVMVMFSVPWPLVVNVDCASSALSYLILEFQLTLLGFL